MQNNVRRMAAYLSAASDRPPIEFLPTVSNLSLFSLALFSNNMTLLLGALIGF